MRATPIIYDGVNLIHDERPRCAQHASARFGSEKEIEGFRRGHQNVWWLLNKGLPLGRGRIAGANFSAHFDFPAIRLMQQCTNSTKWFLKILADIVAQRFER